MSYTEWASVGTLIGGLAQLVGATIAGCYFLYRFYRGHLIPNMGIGVFTERVASTEGNDWLAIKVILKRGDRDTLILFEAKARVENGMGQEIKTVDLWGFRLVDERPAGTMHLGDFATDEEKYSSLTPGEETVLSAVL